MIYTGGVQVRDIRKAGRLLRIDGERAHPRKPSRKILASIGTAIEKQVNALDPDRFVIKKEGRQELRLVAYASEQGDTRHRFHTTVGHGQGSCSNCGI